MHVFVVLRHVPLLMRLLPFALALIALLTFTPRSIAAFPGQNGKVAYSVYNDEGEFYYTCAHLPGGPPMVRNCFSTDGSGLSTEFSAAWSPDGSKLAISGNEGIYVANGDGTGITLILPGDFYPSWSPDGSKVVFESNRDGDVEIYTANSDGTGATRLTNSPGLDLSPAWSPDGSKIAFASYRTGNSEIHVMNANGANVTPLTNDPADDNHPNWSPDGGWLAFGSNRDGNKEIYKMRADGTGVTRLTTDPDVDVDPVWAPDGTKVAFSWTDAACTSFCRYDVRTVNPDGSGFTPLVGPNFDEFMATDFDWQPLPVETPSAFARPKGATPFRASLVPASKTCAAPNRTHGAPLAFPSCAPPVPGSSSLTVGVGDGSPALSKSIGSVRLDVTPSDVNLRMSLTNVMNTSDLSDHIGQLHASVASRLTDKEGSVASTRADFPFKFDVPCTATADTTLGGDCRIFTSFNSLLPGAATSGLRTNWELGRFEVYDGNGALFATQGVFVP